MFKISAFIATEDIDGFHEQSPTLGSLVAWGQGYSHRGDSEPRRDGRMFSRDWVMFLSMQGEKEKKNIQLLGGALGLASFVSSSYTFSGANKVPAVGTVGFNDICKGDFSIRKMGFIHELSDFSFGMIQKGCFLLNLP